MIEIVHFLEFFAKLIFGINLSFSFAGFTIKTNKKEYLQLILSLVLVQFISLLVFGEKTTISIYPFIIHFPIVLFLHFKMKISFLCSVVYLFFAFQFLSPRQWLGSIVGLFFDNNPVILDLSTIILSIPLTILVCRYFAPEISAIKHESTKTVLLIGLSPISFYFFTYFTVIYTDTIKNGGNTLVYMFDAVFNLIFIFYTAFFLKILQEKKETEIEHSALMFIQQASYAEVEQLHKQQELLHTFRHDLRHHISYLENLLNKNQILDAKSYLSSVLKEQDSKIIYASNQSVRLIVHSFKQTCDVQNINFDINIKTDDFSGFDQLHICSLISNGLENAIKFSKEHENPYVFLEIARTDHRLSIFIKNNFSNLPKFHNLRPITKEYGHGYGTKSMASIVEEYNGFSQFYIDCDFFIFRSSLMSR